MPPALWRNAVPGTKSLYSLPLLPGSWPSQFPVWTPTFWTVLTQRPTHLLGLALAIRAADARRDAAARAAFQRRLIAAEQAEMATGLPEYGDHNADIIEAVRAARAP